MTMVISTTAGVVAPHYMHRVGAEERYHEDGEDHLSPENLGEDKFPRATLFCLDKFSLLMMARKLQKALSWA
jgi:hypothetical protein